MTRPEFVIVYVALPLTIALGWLIWRGRYFLRSMLLYGLVVGALLGAVRLGHAAWTGWASWGHAAAPAAPSYPTCVDPKGLGRAGSNGQCWT
jgi:hypothetical protein